MLHIFRNARLARSLSLMGRMLPLAILPAMLACERNAAGPLPDAEVQQTSSFPSMLGSYTATGSGTVTTSVGGSYNLSCSGTISIANQTDSTFSGTFTVANAGDCSSDSGTLWGTVGTDGSVTLDADLSSVSGSDIWQDAEIKSGCTLVSHSAISGTLSGNTLTVSATGTFDCPVWWGTMQVYGTATVTATRS